MEGSVYIVEDASSDDVLTVRNAEGASGTVPRAAVAVFRQVRWFLIVPIDDAQLCLLMLIDDAY